MYSRRFEVSTTSDVDVLSTIVSTSGTYVKHAALYNTATPLPLLHDIICEVLAEKTARGCRTVVDARQDLVLLVEQYPGILDRLVSDSDVFSSREAVAEWVIHASVDDTVRLCRLADRSRSTGSFLRDAIVRSAWRAAGRNRDHHDRVQCIMDTVGSGAGRQPPRQLPAPPVAFMSSARHSTGAHIINVQHDTCSAAALDRLTQRFNVHCTISDPSFHAAMEHAVHTTTKETWSAVSREEMVELIEHSPVAAVRSIENVHLMTPDAFSALLGVSYTRSALTSIMTSRRDAMPPSHRALVLTSGIIPPDELLNEVEYVLSHATGYVRTAAIDALRHQLMSPDSSERWSDVPDVYPECRAALLHDLVMGYIPTTDRAIVLQARRDVPLDMWSYATTDILARSIAASDVSLSEFWSVGALLGSTSLSMEQVIRTAQHFTCR